VGSLDGLNGEAGYVVGNLDGRTVGCVGNRVGWVVLKDVELVGSIMAGSAEGVGGGVRAISRRISAASGIRTMRTI
jgi:hypothetical protein